MRMATVTLALIMVWAAGNCTAQGLGDDSANQLFVAAASGNVSQVGALLEHGANANCAREDGLTPLMIAAIAGHTEVVKRLVNGGANANARDGTGATALIWVSSAGSEDMVRLLLQSGADPAISDRRGRTALSVAAEKGRANLVAMLKQQQVGSVMPPALGERSHSPDVDQQLVLASVEGNVSAVRRLLGAGAAVEAKDPESGGTPLIWACLKGHTAVVKVLLDSGANANASAEENLTPLLVACATGHKEAVELLLKKGADIDAKSQEGLSAFRIASQKQYTEILQVLMKHAARVSWAEAVVNTPDAPGKCLRVKSSPSRHAKQVGCIKLGEKLLLNGFWSDNNWVQIFRPAEGWVPAANVHIASMPGHKRAVLSFQESGATGGRVQASGNQAEESYQGAEVDDASDEELEGLPSRPLRKHGWH